MDLSLDMGIFILIVAQMLVLLPNIQGTFGYQSKEFYCGTLNMKCSFPTQFCDGDACSNCSPECQKPYQDRSYGCEVFCNNLSENDSKTKVCSLEPFRNGKLYDGCSGRPGVICGYRCADKYTKNPGLPAVQCLSSGKWSSDVNQLCKPTIQCQVMKSLNAEMESHCNMTIGSSCDIKCKAGHGENQNGKTVWCLPSGKWTQDIDAFCQKERGINGNVLKIVPNYVWVAGLSMLTGILLTLLVVWILRRCKRNRQDREETPDEKVGLQPAEDDDGEYAGNEENNIPGPAFNNCRDWGV